MKLSNMLLSIFAVSKAAAAPVSSASDAVIKQEDDTPMEFEVEIDVECEGDAMKKANLHNGIYAGKVRVRRKCRQTYVISVSMLEAILP